MIFHEDKYLDVINDLKEIILDVLSKIFLGYENEFEISLIPIKNEITLMSIFNIDGIKKYDIYLEYELVSKLQLMGVIDKNGKLYLYAK